MANIVTIKRSSVAGKQPNVSDLQVGELALNLADGIIYSKNTVGNVIVVGASTNYVNTKANVSVSTSAPSSNQIGDIWINSDTGKEYLWYNDGSSYQWVEENGSLYVSTSITDVVGITSGSVSNAQIVSGITSTGVFNTSNVTEGTNLYFTNARAYANVTLLGYVANTYVNTRLLTKANVSDLTTANVSEVTNIYFTNARVYSNVTQLGFYSNSTVITNNNVITSNAATAFVAGDAAISGVALQIPREGGIRNLYNGDNSIYYDVSIGGSTHGHHIFRGSSSYTRYAMIDVNGIQAISSYLGKTSFNVALDTEVTVDNIKYRISNQGGIFPQAGNASGSSIDICWSTMAVVSGGSVSSQNTGTIITSGNWTTLYAAHGLDSRGDTIVAHITDKAAGKIYRVTFLVTNNASNTTGYNIIVERII